MISAPEMFELITKCKWPELTAARATANNCMILGILATISAWDHSKIAVGALLSMLIMQWIGRIVVDRRHEQLVERYISLKSVGLNEEK